MTDTFDQASAAIALTLGELKAALFDFDFESIDPLTGKMVFMANRRRWTLQLSRADDFPWKLPTADRIEA